MVWRKQNGHKCWKDKDDAGHNSTEVAAFAQNRPWRADKWHELTSGERRETTRGRDRLFPLLVLTRAEDAHHDCSRHIALLCRIKKYLPHQARQTFYHSFILPHMDYCSTLWGDATAAERIHKLQKRAASHYRLALQNAQRPTLRTASLAVAAWPRQIQESATGIQISEGPGSGLYVRTVRVSTDGLIAKHTFKCQRWPVRTTSPDTVVPEHTNYIWCKHMEQTEHSNYKLQFSSRL